MSQIVLNLSFIFLLPAILGGVFRIGIGESKKGYILPLVSSLLACIMWWLSYNVDNRGSEANGVYSISITCFAIGTIFGEVYSLFKSVIQKRKNKKQ